jgi:hypothetical protein
MVKERQRNAFFKITIYLEYHLAPTLYSKYMVVLINAFRWSFFHHNLKNAWSKLQKGSKKFKSRGLHEKHAVANWGLGIHLSIRF